MTIEEAQAAMDAAVAANVAAKTRHDTAQAAYLAASKEMQDSIAAVPPTTAAVSKARVDLMNAQNEARRNQVPGDPS